MIGTPDSVTTRAGLILSVMSNIDGIGRVVLNTARELTTVPMVGDELLRR